MGTDKRAKKPGVGKGGNQKYGTDHPGYTNGISFYISYSKNICTERSYCERCGKDLRKAVRGTYHCHHRDHDRQNNDESNFELLCSPCHTEEHLAKHYIFRNPYGIKVEIFNLDKFCRENNLTSPLMHAVLKGIQTHHKGWTV